MGKCHETARDGLPGEEMKGTGAMGSMRASRGDQGPDKGHAYGLRLPGVGTAILGLVVSEDLFAFSWPW